MTDDTAKHATPIAQMDEATRQSHINHHLAELVKLQFPDLDGMPDAKHVRAMSEQFERLHTMILRLSPGSSRALSLSMTHLETSFLWLNRHLSQRSWR